jgi:hypothetical protein
MHDTEFATTLRLRNLITAQIFESQTSDIDVPKLSHWHLLLVSPSQLTVWQADGHVRVHSPTYSEHIDINTGTHTAHSFPKRYILYAGISFLREQKIQQF